MEGGKQSGSSLASDLFGAKDSSPPASSSGIFASIFSPSSKVHSSQTEKKIDPSWIAKTHTLDKFSTTGEGRHRGTTNKGVNSYYEDQKVDQPFHYSSSIYYGGQDVYSRPQDVQQNPTFNKDGGEDDSDSASRGNWWQGNDASSIGSIVANST